MITNNSKVVFRCNRCKLTFDSTSKVYWTMKSKGEEKVYQCPECFTVLTVEQPEPKVITK